MKILSVVIIVLTFTATLVQAEEGSIQAVFTTWEPYGYLEDGKAVGFELEIFAAVMDAMKRPVEFIERPWKRCLYMVQRGEADVVISALKTSEREAFLYFPQEPISLSQTAFFTTTTNPIEFNGAYESLKDYTIGVVSGFSYGPDFDAAGFLTKDEATSSEQVLKKLLAGRYEIAVGNIAVISSIAEKLGERQNIRFLTPLVHSQELYVGFSKAKGHEKLAQDFSNALAEFKASPEYKAILTRYGIPVPGE